MPNPTISQPTLWRTCRVLANRTRLNLLYLLMDEPHQRVSLLAARLRLSQPDASRNLRALEARSLLQSRRSGRHVEYSITPAVNAGSLEELMKALRAQLQRGPSSVDAIFREATAFTHPRRIDLFRAASAGGQNLEQLRRGTRISARALLRHAVKLEARGLLHCREGVYGVTAPKNSLAQALVRLALG